MKFISIITAAAALFSSIALAAPTPFTPTTLLTKRQPASDIAFANVIAVNGQDETPIQIPFGKLTQFENLKITGFKLDGIEIDSSDLPGSRVPIPTVDQVACQRYQDEYGIRPGSIAFTKDEEALVSLNAVEFGWVLCYVRPQE